MSKKTKPNDSSRDAMEPTANERHIAKKIQLPDILDQVDYIYSNHASLSATKWDIRIAFGDIRGTGTVHALAGVILPHLAAKGLAEALQRMVDRAEERMGPIEDPDVGDSLNVDIKQ